MREHTMEKKEKEIYEKLKKSEKNVFEKGDSFFFMNENTIRRGIVEDIFLNYDMTKIMYSFGALVFSSKNMWKSHIALCNDLVENIK